MFAAVPRLLWNRIEGFPCLETDMGGRLYIVGVEFPKGLRALPDAAEKFTHEMVIGGWNRNFLSVDGQRVGPSPIATLLLYSKHIDSVRPVRRSNSQFYANGRFFEATGVRLAPGH